MDLIAGWDFSGQEATSNVGEVFGEALSTRSCGEVSVIRLREIL